MASARLPARLTIIEKPCLVQRRRGSRKAAFPQFIGNCRHFDERVRGHRLIFLPRSADFGVGGLATPRTIDFAAHLNGKRLWQIDYAAEVEL